MVRHNSLAGEISLGWFHNRRIGLGHDTPNYYLVVDLRIYCREIGGGIDVTSGSFGESRLYSDRG